MKITHEMENHPTYHDDQDHFSAWFKFGCAHIHGAAGAGQSESDADYLHVCDVPAFIKWLQEAYAARSTPYEGED